MQADEAEQKRVGVFLRALEAELDQLAREGQNAVVAEKTEFADLEMGDLTRAAVGAAFAALRERRDIDTEERRVLADLGALRARQGVPLHAMVYGFRRIAVLVMERSRMLADRHRIGAETMYELLSRQWAWVIDALSIASEEHRKTELELIHDRQEKRAAFLHGLFSGTIGAGDLQAAAAEHGLDPQGTYFAFRTAANDSGSRRRLAQTGFVESYEGGLAGLQARPPQVHVGDLIAIGTMLPLSAAPVSFTQATTAFTVAQAFELTGLVSITDVPVQAAVMAEREMGAFVTERCFGAFSDQHRPLYQQTLAAYLTHDMNAKAAADALHLHPNTMRYRIRRFEETSALRLDRVDDMVAVWWALQHLRIAGHQRRSLD
ncbi:PucR family transcriptional regulator [Streptomyces sp. NPDC056296]|uniref:PucR family transcriptional regulator n=1 Tax=Streptomyces sp. NPDC056296 TaxID=3345775 RepID=UPI0035DFC8EE